MYELIAEAWECYETMQTTGDTVQGAPKNVPTLPIPGDSRDTTTEDLPPLILSVMKTMKSLLLAGKTHIVEALAVLAEAANPGDGGDGKGIEGTETERGKDQGDIDGAVSKAREIAERHLGSRVDPEKTEVPVQKRKRSRR
jgi:hypothetical protein